MLSAHGTVTIRPREVVPVYREEWDATVTDYKYNLVNRDFVSRNGNLYQVKVQKPKEFVPAGIDPDSEIGEDYWEVFNKLAPSVTNFLVIIDEDGKPQTLLSGGRIQTRFLNIGSLNMSETRLWGGAEPMTGKGLALVNDPGDRKFVVYNDSRNYVEMFQRENEWGLKGVINGNVDNPVFQLGSTNKIGGFEITNNRIGSIFGTGGVGDGMSLYDYVVKFKSANSGDSRFAAIGTQVYPSSSAQVTLLRLEATRSGISDNILSYFSCDGASGVLGSRNIAIKIGNGDVDVDNGNFVGNIISGVYMANMTGTNPGILLGNEHPNIICLHGTGSRKKVTLYAGMRIGKFFFITSDESQGFDVVCSGSERFYRNGNAYMAVKSNGQDTVLVMKVDEYSWTACQMPVNWLDVWNP